MGLLEELKHALGLDDEEVPPPSEGRDVIHLQQPPASFGPSPLRHLSPEEDRAAAEVQRNPDAPLMGPRPTLDPRRWLSPGDAPELQKAQLEADETDDPSNGVMVPPPPEKYKAVYVDQQNQLSPARDLDSARILAEASQTLRGRQGVAKGAGRFLKPASEAARAVSEPPGKAPPDTGKADLLAAIDKVAKPPEDAAEQPAPAQGERPDPNPGPPPPTPPPESGGPLGSLTKMMMGAGADPRTERLRAALEKAAEMKRLAGHQRGMGIGADLVMGTHVHGDQGKDLEGRADDEVRNAMLPTEFEQKNARFDTEQQRAAQDMRLRESSEGRAQKGELRAEAGETRAGAEESRKGESFKTQQGYTDPASQTSANARASIESLYPAAWKKIPEAQRNNFSAKDVERIFGEVSQKDFASRLGGGGMQDRFVEKQVQDYNKSRVTDRTVEAVNNLMGRLEDKSPIQGFDAAKGWAQASKVPVFGGLLSGAGNSAVRGTEMEGIAQDAMAIMQQISLDTSGKVLNETEIRNIEKRLGLATGQGEDAFRRAMTREFEAIQSKADRDFSSYAPESRSRIEQRGLRPHFKSKRPDYAPKENSVLDERAKDTETSFFNREPPPAGGIDDKVRELLRRVHAPKSEEERRKDDEERGFRF